MEAKELRIGSWYINDCDDSYIQLTEDNIVAAILDEDWLLPIPLTPEILEKAGFTTDEGKVEYVIGLPIGFGSDLFIENEDHESMSCGIKDYQGGFHYFKDIKYLHQLQNLFFAICGEELKIEL